MAVTDTRELHLSYDDDERSRALDVYLRLFLVVYLRRWPLMLLAAVVAAAGLGYFLRHNAINAPDRFQARTVLFYEPFVMKNYKPMDIKQLVALFERRSLLQSVKEELASGEGERELTSGPVKMTVPRGQNHLLAINAYGISSAHAVNLANTVAQRCLVAYREYREQELNGEIATLERAREQKQEQLNKVNDVLLKMAHDLNVVTVEEELARLQASIALQQAGLEEVRNNAVVLEARIKDNQRLLSGMEGAASTTLLRHGPQLQEFEKRLQALNRRLTEALHLYTEDNPKIASLRLEIQDCRREYDQYLKQNNIKDYNPDQILLFDKITMEQTKISSELKAIQLRAEGMAKRLAEEMARRKRLQEMLPQFRKEEQHRQRLWEDIKEVEAKIAEKNTLISVTGNEVKQIEACRDATVNIGFGWKKILIAIVGGIVFGMSLGAVLSFMHLLGGNVTDRVELLSFENLILLGKYPESPKLIRGGRELELAQSKVFRALRHVLKDQGGVIMVGVMPGGKDIEELDAALDWHFGMDGKKVAHVDLIAAEAFSGGEGGANDAIGDDLTSIHFSGVRGVLPLDSVSSFSPVELKMLQSDCQTLLTKFDLVVFHCQANFDSHDLLWEQIMDVADAMVLYVGAERTSRYSLHTVSLLQKRILKPIMTIMGVKRKWEQV